MIRSFDDASCYSFSNPLSIGRSEPTVGIYEEIAKSKILEPGGDRPFRL